MNACTRARCAGSSSDEDDDEDDNDDEDQDNGEQRRADSRDRILAVDESVLNEEVPRDTYEEREEPETNHDCPEGAREPLDVGVHRRRG